MNTHNSHPMTVLLAQMQTRNSNDALFIDELSNRLPPYPLLLPSLLDWAATPEAMESSYVETYEMALFHSLQSLRVDLRQGTNDASECWQQVQALLNEALGIAHKSVLCHSLLHRLAELDFAMPEKLIEKIGQWHLAQCQYLADDNSEDSAALSESMLSDMLATLESESILDIYEMFKTEYYYLPVDGANVLLQQLLRAEQHLLREAGLLFLLHPRSALREQLLLLLPQPGIIDGLDDRSRDRLIMLRNWLPVSQGKRLDPVIKQLRLRDLPPHTHNRSTIIELWACAMDGVGATAVILMKRDGSLYRLSGLVFKEGVGIVDCWQSPLQSKAAIEHLLANLIEHFPHGLPVTRTYMEQLVPHYLALNTEGHELPDPSVLEWLEQLDGGLWQPNRLQHERWLAELYDELSVIDKNAAFKRCQQWFDDNQNSLCWLENDDFIHSVAAQAVVDQIEPEAEFFTMVFEPYRQKWRNRFILLAIRSRYCQGSLKNKPHWQDFALLAWHLECEDTIADLPIVHSIICESVRAAVLEGMDSPDNK